MKSKHAAILVICSSLMLGMTGSLPVAAEELTATTLVTEESNNQQTTQLSTPETEINNSEIDDMLDKIFSNEEYVQRMFDRIHQTYGGQGKGGKGFRMQNPQLNDQANPGNQTAPGGDSTPLVHGNGQMPRRHRRFGNSQSPWEMQSPQNGLLMSASSDAV